MMRAIGTCIQCIELRSRHDVVRYKKSITQSNAFLVISNCNTVCRAHPFSVTDESRPKIVEDAKHLCTSMSVLTQNDIYQKGDELAEA